MITYYNTEADYLAAARSTEESEVSLIGATNDVKYDGVNVVVGIKGATTGSILMLHNGVLRFIPCLTFNKDALPEDATYPGVVAVGVDDPDFRGQLVIVNRANASKKLSEIHSFKLTGYTLDGTDRTGILSIRTADAWNTAKDFTVSYNASSVADFVTQLNAYFSANEEYTPAGGTAMDNPFRTQSWVATADDNDVITLTFLFTSYQQASNAGKTGFALTVNFLPEITATTNMLRMNGYRSGEGTITNMDRALTYFRPDNSSTTYNPSSDVTSPKRGYPICLPGYLGTSQYQSDHCAALRAIYGEGEEGWKKFMASFLPVRPTAYGSVGDKAKYGDGYTNTAKMVGKTFTKQDGTTIAVHPAAEYCAAMTYEHELLGAGKWCMPDADTVIAIMKYIRYGTNPSRNADIINRALNAIGGSAISNGSNVWSSSRYGANYAWYSVGYYGYASANLFCYENLALPVLLLDVREANS